MRVDRIYYFADDVTQAVVDFLRKRNGFRKIPFVALTEADVVQTSTYKQGFPIYDDKAVLIWGEGDYHHASYWFSAPFANSKSVDDAHEDLDPIGQDLDCGNHNYHLLKRDPYVRRLEVLGCAPEISDDIFEPPPLRAERCWVQPTDRHYPERPYWVRERLESSLTGAVVHKSIDFDVTLMFPSQGDYRWDGNWGIWISSVKRAFETSLKENDVVRLDVGGLGSQVLRWTNFIQRRIGLMAYHDVLDMYLSSN